MYPFVILRMWYKPATPSRSVFSSGLIPLLWCSPTAWVVE